MILDLHVHTTLSGDAKPTAEEYAEQILKIRKKFHIDGFVITEHRLWNPERDEELAEISRKTDVVILQGIEMETDYGHILVYGVTTEFTRRIDISKRVKAPDVVKAALETGGVPVAAHPTRQMVGCGMALRGLNGIRVIEIFNGGCTSEENESAERIMKELNMYGAGGSDAHFLDDLGACVTVFDNPVRSTTSLVRELSLGNYDAKYLNVITTK